MALFRFWHDKSTVELEEGDVQGSNDEGNSNVSGGESNVQHP